MEIYLHSDLIYANKLDTHKFARMLDDTTQCYKFYWLEAIINLISVSDNDLSFDQIINEMICEAWYSVTQYHLHLGPQIKGKSENYLEHAVKVLESDNDIKQPAARMDILSSIIQKEAELKNDKNSLAINVPYRLISSFLDEFDGEESTRIWDQRRKLIAYIEKTSEQKNLLYTIIDGPGLNKKIRVNKYWKQLILDNFPVIISWIQLKKIRFLQDRNPGVPGIIYKLSQENGNVRKLSNTRDLWKAVLESIGVPFRDIYSGRKLDVFYFDLDHFVPWSYVANDELWNLIPMEKRLNSSKSNRLPEWDIYFEGMVSAQYVLYKTVFEFPGIRNQFEKCRRDNLNAIWAAETLYVDGKSEEQFKNILERNLKPLNDSAYLQGYGLWKLPDYLAT